MTRYLVNPVYTHASQRWDISSCMCVVNLPSFFKNISLMASLTFGKTNLSEEKSKTLFLVKSVSLLYWKARLTKARLYWLYLVFFTSIRIFLSETFFGTKNTSFGWLCFLFSWRSIFQEMPATFSWKRMTLVLGNLRITNYFSIADNLKSQKWTPLPHFLHNTNALKMASCKKWKATLVFNSWDFLTEEQLPVMASFPSTPPIWRL